PRTDADKYTPETTPETVAKGGTVDLTDNVKPITDESGKPVEVTVKDVTPEGAIDTNKPGNYTGKVEITYPDGSKEVVDVPVTIVDPRTDADKYTPETTPETVAKGGKVDLTDNVKPITDESGKPVEVTVKDVTPEGVIDTNTPGDYTGKVEITYPDGSTEVIDVPVTIVNPRTDADKYTPETTPETVAKGGKVDLTDNVKPITDESGKPVEVTVKDVTPEGAIDTNKPGNYTGKVEITYPDGSKEVVDVPVTIVDPRTDADKYTPETTPETVAKGGKVDLTDNVKP
ncbi:Rib/alpha-like domain-containing protein, partial [Streptococcus sp. NLN64]|uniref:Rib/alpha-like domain-containing protein n=1 Tax=Streptococcus sp. NLN64 TaxID=2822799 RepID=UPI001A2A2FBF